MLHLQAILESHNKRQHIAPAALDSQQVARPCGGRYEPTMIRYIFVIFIFLMGIVINFAVFSQNLKGGSLLLAALTINLFVMSLLCFWSGAYINRLKHGGLMVFGHAILFLAAGTGFFGLGYHSIMSKSCIFLVNDTASRNMISRAADWAIVNDYCPWLGIGLMLFGIFMAWPSFKLFFSFMRLKGT